MLKGIKSAFTNVVDGIKEGQRLRAEEAAERQRQEQLYIQAIREGRLTPVHSRLMLETSEICYLESDATHTRQMKNGPKDEYGLLTLTSTRLIFTGQGSSGNWSVNLNNVMSVTGNHVNVNLQTTNNRSSGSLRTQVIHAALIIEAAAKLHKRLMEMPEDGSRSRHLSQAVKTAVWQRDQGRCVDCGATEYLEFDHVIPVSKGGANSEGNIQLLCRACNLKKSDRN